MKRQALEVVERIVDPGEKLNRLREYLQAFVLRSLHESEALKIILDLCCFLWYILLYGTPVLDAL